MPETLQQLKVRTAREIKQRTASVQPYTLHPTSYPNPNYSTRFLRTLPGLQGLEGKRRAQTKTQTKTKTLLVVQDYSVFLLVLLFLAYFIVLLLVLNLFYLQQILLDR
jgi:hypothetical protein